jgi:small subunit ribosomal protein S27e
MAKEKEEMKINMDDLVKEPRSRFIKVRCSKCKNEQIIFGKSSTEINCLVCDKPISSPTGGKTKTKARVLEVLE